MRETTDPRPVYGAAQEPPTDRAFRALTIECRAALIAQYTAAGQPVPHRAVLGQRALRCASALREDRRPGRAGTGAGGRGAGQAPVSGAPHDLGAARQLAADDRPQFQRWALALIAATPLGGDAGSPPGTMGADGGIDGVIPFCVADATERVLVQVKSDPVTPGDIRALVGTVARAQAAIGVFVTLEAPSRHMLMEAARAGVYLAPGGDTSYPRIQILTIAALLKGAKVAMPPLHGTFRQAPRAAGSAAQQGTLGLG